MANTYLGTRSPKGNVGVRGVVDSGELSAYSLGTLSGFTAASVTASWTLNLGGVSTVQDVAVAKNVGGESDLLVSTTGQTIAFTIGGAPGTPGQSRTDALVAYKDVFDTATTNDGIDSCDYLVVAGTAATTGTQVPPTMTAIRAACPTGAMVAVLGYATIAQGQTSVSLGNYSRNMSTALNAPVVVANAIEKSWLPLITGLKCWQTDTAMEQIYDGSTWINIPRILKRTSLTVAGDQISLQNIPARNSLKINFFCVSSGSIHPWLRINNDGNNRYTCRYRADTTDGSVTSQAQIPVGNSGGLHQSGTIQLNDYSGLALKECTVQTTCLDGNIAGVPGAFIGHGAYNQATAITRLDINNAGAGDFNIGSWAEVIG
jgi:hypothetical protein